MGNIDIGALKEKSAYSVVKYLVHERMQSVESQWQSALKDKNHKISLAPINPLLLSSTISISLLNGCDFNSFLDSYTAGLDLPNLEASLLRISIDNDKKLGDFLRLEERYIEAFLQMALEMIITLLVQDTFEQISKDDQNSQLLQSITIEMVLSECREIVRADNIPDDWRFDRYSVRQTTWIVANPIYILADVVPTDRALGVYSLSINDKIHKNREYYEYQASEIDKQVNTVLKSELSKEEKKKALTQAKEAQTNATLLKKRARRLYEWLPHELEAFSTEWMGRHKFGLSTNSDHLSLSDTTKIVLTGMTPFGIRLKFTDMYNTFANKMLLRFEFEYNEKPF